MMLDRVECSDSAAPVGTCCSPPLALSSMRPDLAVDQLEPPPRILNLLAQTRSELRHKVAVLPRSSFGIEMQLINLAVNEHMPFHIERSNIALRMLHLPRDAEKLSTSTLPSD